MTWGNLDYPGIGVLNRPVGQFLDPVGEDGYAGEGRDVQAMSRCFALARWRNRHIYLAYSGREIWIKRGIIGPKGGKMGADFNRTLSGGGSFSTKANDTARLISAVRFRLSLEWRRVSKFCKTKSTGGRFYREGKA